MSNPQNQFWVHPITGEGFTLRMEEEEFAPIVNMADEDAKKQAILSLYVRWRDEQATRQVDLDAFRDARVTDALNVIRDDDGTIDADITALAAATTLAQVKPLVANILQRQKRMLLREKAIIKRLALLV